MGGQVSRIQLPGAASVDAMRREAEQVLADGMAAVNRGDAGVVLPAERDGQELRPHGEQLKHAPQLTVGETLPRDVAECESKPMLAARQSRP